MQKSLKKFSIRKIFSITDSKTKKHDTLLKKTRLTTCSYFRRQSDGVVPQERPPLEFHKILQQMRYISNNMNQLAKRANATNHVDAEKIMLLAEQFKPLASQLYLYVTLPVKRNKDAEVIAEYFKKGGK